MQKGPATTDLTSCCPCTRKPARAPPWSAPHAASAAAGPPAEQTASTSEFDGLVLISAGRDLLRGPAVLKSDLTLEDNALGKGHITLDDDLLAVDERRRAVGDELLHCVNELVHVVQLDRGRHVLALLLQRDPEVRRERVGVRPQREEVARGLHGGEAGAGHHEGRRALEALDRSTHGRLQLQHERRGFVARVHSLVVLHDRQRQEAVVLLELRLQCLQVDPEVVGVEELVPLGVLECLLVLLRALRRLAEQQVAGGLVLGQVPALAVRGRALRGLHHEGGARIGEVGEDLEVHRGAEVVGVGHKHVLEAFLQQFVQGAAAEHRRIEVAVPRRAPLVAGLLLPSGRAEIAGSHLGCLVLHELKVGALAELLVRGERLERVCGRGERVHKHELNLGLELLVHGPHLLGDQVQETVALRDGQERLRLVETHASAEASIQLQNDRLLEQRRIGLDLDLLVVHEALDGVDRGLRDHDVGAGGQHAEVVLEGGDGGLVAALLLHLRLVGWPQLRELGGSAGAHDVHEGGLQGGAADEKAVDVGLADELLAVLRRHAAAVLDLDVVSDLGADGGLEVGADGGVRLLGLIRGGDLAGADGPDRLVGDDDLLGVEKTVDLCHLHIHLSKHGTQALLADFLWLADAEDARHARIEDVLQLGRKSRVVVHRQNAKLPTALGMPDKHLADAHVLHLLHSHLARERTATLEVAILRCDQGIVRELVRAIRDVQRRWAHIHVALAGVASIDVGDEAIECLHRLGVALPIATDDWPARGTAHGCSKHSRGSCDSTG
mmetsp:Transcript_11641/g.31335  ORF Transcript_11641/g.31335 Transcript_11641/m.31335 type:complete len:782 (-) Transcript_11641:241-2586(-)